MKIVHVNTIIIEIVNMALGSVVNKLCSILLLESDINRDANPVSFPSHTCLLFACTLSILVLKLCSDIVTNQ